MRTPGGIIIPPSVSSVKPPRFRCHICKADFHEGEANAWQRHIAKCVKRHEAEIREASLRHQLPGFYDPEQWDAEFERYARQHPEKWDKGTM